jgi:hypothetical protein
VPSKSDRPTLDELAEAWQPERPTDRRIKRIESIGPPESYPPPSTASLVRGLRAWAKANAWLIAILGATGGTMGVSRLPWGEWLGLVTKAEYGAAIAARDARIVKLEKAQKEQSRALAAVKAGCAAASDVADLKSQFNALDERQESVEVKPKRRR